MTDGGSLRFPQPLLFIMSNDDYAQTVLLYSSVISLKQFI